MTVLILERVPPGLRGELTRWLFEVQSGTFVGDVSARVRDRLWARVEDALDTDGSALQLWRTNTAQGFDVRALRPRGRYVEDVDGLWLVRRP